MSRIPARIMGAAATVALVLVPVATASSAAAAVPPTQRNTIAMGMATMVGELARMDSEIKGIDGRSTRSLRAAMDAVNQFNAHLGAGFVSVTGLTDSNRDGLDDDAKVKVRSFNNVATVTVRKNRTFSVVDGGFVFKNRLSVLKESAEAFDRVLRFAAATGIDSWDMQLIKELRAEMPTGVRVVSEYDGNRDGYDDDGRLTFLANGKAVTLTIGNTVKEIGKVTYGPTWKTKAPKRTHRPVAAPYQGLASLIK